MNEGKNAAKRERPDEPLGDFDIWANRFHDYYPPGSRLEMEYRLSRLLVLAGRSWITHIDNMLRNATGQSRARWQALFTIAFGPQPATMTDLGARLFVQWPTLVRVIEGLEQDGLVSRVENPRDGRSRLISLTEAGMAMVTRIQPILDKERQDVLEGLNEAELTECAELLQRIFDKTAR